MGILNKASTYQNYQSVPKAAKRERLLNAAKRERLLNGKINTHLILRKALDLFAFEIYEFSEGGSELNQFEEWIWDEARIKISYEAPEDTTIGLRFNYNFKIKTSLKQFVYFRETTRSDEWWSNYNNSFVYWIK